MAIRTRNLKKTNKNDHNVVIRNLPEFQSDKKCSASIVSILAYIRNILFNILWANWIKTIKVTLLKQNQKFANYLKYYLPSFEIDQPHRVTIRSIQMDVEIYIFGHLWGPISKHFAGSIVKVCLFFVQPEDILWTTSTNEHL